MTLVGKYVKTWAEANIAGCDDMHMGGGYPHPFFHVEGVEGEETLLGPAPERVRLRSGRQEFTFPIERDRFGEYAVIEQKGTYEAVFDQPAKKFKVRPMQGDIH